MCTVTIEVPSKVIFDLKFCQKVLKPKLLDTGKIVFNFVFIIIMIIIIIMVYSFDILN